MQVLGSSISGRFLKPEVTSENESRKMTFFSKLVSTRMRLNARTTNTNWAISVQGLSWLHLASDSAFLEVRGKVFHNVGVKRDSSIGFICWQSLLSLLRCCTVLNQSSFTLTVSGNIFILSLPSISFRFHLMEMGRLGKGGHRVKEEMVGRKKRMSSPWSSPFLHKRHPPINEKLLAGIHNLWC